MSKTCIVIE